jgi:tRNA pseudouridine65 synthase
VAPDIPLLFVDDHVVVANKPSGLLVHRGWDNDDDVALFRVRDKLGAHVYPIHRLDRGTSGALVFARTRDAAAALGRSFEARRAEKQYLALVRGVPKEESGSIDYAIPKSEDGPRVAALTHYRLLARSPAERCSLVLAFPETGRYGSGELNRHYRAGYGLHRLALHASEIRFEHPATGAALCVTAPLPDDLAGPLAALGLAYSPNARTYTPSESPPPLTV